MRTETSSEVNTRPWRRALLWGIGLTIAGRVVALGLGLMLWQPDQIPAGPDYVEPHELEAAPVMGSISGWTTGVWQRHDTLLYLEVAGHG
jgi:Gpi18-like mannosyltransferase